MTGWKEAIDFFEKSLLLETDECIIWPYTKTKGHGMVRVRRSMVWVSAESLRRRVGPAPETQPNSLHKCQNAACFNYRHLKWGDQAENHDDQILSRTFTTRFNEEEIHWIRRQRYLGYSASVISDYLKVPRETIKNILSDYRYRWVAKLDPSLVRTIGDI